MCGHNGYLLYLSLATFGSCTGTGEMGEPFPVCPGIERRGENLLVAEWGLVK